MSDLVWDDLKYFALVGREGSVALAAKQTGVEHSTVTRRITRLEEALQLRLFNRMARGWHLTEEGEALLVRVARVEDGIVDVRKVASSLENARGTVCVTAPPTFLAEVIVPALAGFQEAHPHIDLRLVGETREANLSRGEADIAFRMASIEGAELVTRTVCEVTYAFYGRARWRDVPAHEHVFIGFSRNDQQFLQEAVELHAGERRIIAHTNDLRVALRFADDGAGIALLPRFLAAEHDGLEIVAAPDPAIARPVQLVMQRDVRKAGRVRTVADYLCARIPRHP
ncbi:LysR family transcriptional regulator [Salinarimonas ramus]|uniref:LysR family transcriptional regulator n=1 Tax=Salinarimonas ramus TaxID=690164 RepID=A0A917QHH9_9HYPH|nr:LysR family transcriptional regulator [Salinarimonas ramus]GGK49280.1 LysR family transcriptional regulator [Salinarimonas ramus]